MWEDQELILFIINEEENEMLVELGKEIANIDGENQVVELCSIEVLGETEVALQSIIFWIFSKGNNEIKK